MPIPNPKAPATQKLVSKLSPGQGLEWIYVKPLPWAEELACIDVVDRAIAENGGRRILGWALWEWPGVIVEGEFHAIWEKPDGDRIDPTPKQDKEKKILFLPDPKAEIKTFQNDNVRMPLQHRKEILDFIDIKERLFRARNKGTDAFSRFYAITPHLEYLLSEERRILCRLVTRFGPPPAN